MTKLDTLRQQYKKARQEAFDARVLVMQPSPDERRCWYCGLYWWKFPGSLLDGHAKCIVTTGFKQWLVTFTQNDAKMTFPLIADALGVRDSVVRAWYSDGLKELGRPRGR